MGLTGITYQGSVHPHEVGTATPLPVRIGDGTSLISLDSDTSALLTIESQHQQIHNGNVYSVCNIFESVADNSNADMTLTVPAGKILYMVGSMDSGGDSYVYIYENPTTSANGTAVTPINHNRQSSNTSTTTAYHTPTVTGVGTQLRCKFVAGGAGGRAVGASTEVYQEFILNSSTKYLIRVTNKSGQAKTMSISATWYERTL